VSDPQVVRLLEELAAGTGLDRAAQAAGYPGVEAAADALRTLARRAAAPPRRKAADVAEALPGPPPRRSPYPAGAEAVVHADGASRGNPGPAAYGCVYLGEDGIPLCAEGGTVGRATNNVAEYRGAIAALERLLAWGVGRVRLRLDSQLVVRQLEGRYRVRDEGLKPLHARARTLLDGFDAWSVEHVPRAENALADRVANRALDRATTRG
jgi:ribonuclease HI